MAPNINNNHRNKAHNKILLHTKQNPSTKTTYCRISRIKTMVTFGGKDNNWELLKGDFWISGKVPCLNLGGGYISRKHKQKVIKL